MVDASGSAGLLRLGPGKNGENVILYRRAWFFNDSPKLLPRFHENKRGNEMNVVQCRQPVAARLRSVDPVEADPCRVDTRHIDNFEETRDLPLAVRAPCPEEYQEINPLVDLLDQFDYVLLYLHRVVRLFELRILGTLDTGSIHPPKKHLLFYRLLRSSASPDDEGKKQGCRVSFHISRTFVYSRNEICYLCTSKM